MFASTRAIELDPKLAYAFASRGSAYNNKGEYDRAIADATRAIELDPNLAAAFGNRAYAYNQKGEFERSIPHHTRYIQMDPNEAVAYNNRGFAYLRTGRLDLARTDLEKALALKSPNPEAKSSIAELEQAEASAKMAATPAPSPPQQAAVEPVKPALETPPAPAQAPSPIVPLGKRVALVVGNSDYSNILRLDNPLNDANLVAQTLRGLGFTLIGGGAQTNLDKAGFDSVVQSFGKELQGADVALFYYAGHGVRVPGQNYLVPVSANPTREVDVDFQMVDVALVLRQMEASGTRLNLVMLDACRNNPFASRGLRASGGGLAQMQAPEGTLISFAAQPGNVAQDGSDGHSPYTRALAEVINSPGLDIFQTFNRVGLEVKRAHGRVAAALAFKLPHRGCVLLQASVVAAPGESIEAGRIEQRLACSPLLPRSAVGGGPVPTRVRPLP